MAGSIIRIIGNCRDRQQELFDFSYFLPGIIGPVLKKSLLVVRGATQGTWVTRPLLGHDGLGIAAVHRGQRLRLRSLNLAAYCDLPRLHLLAWVRVLPRSSSQFLLPVC